MAERSGVSVRTIRRLETGKYNDHRLGTLTLLADALQVGPEDRQLLVAMVAQPQATSDPTPAKPDPAPIAAPVRLPVPASARVLMRGALEDAAHELAREVRRRWQREEEQRRVHDPFPLPVRWGSTHPSLTDHPANVEGLAPGAVSHGADLSGDLSSVADFYRGIASGRLVILGRAGSGKSILTIRFVLDHLEAQASLARVPVIFSIGSWDPSAVELRDWLVDLLVRDHPYLTRRVPSGSTLAAALVEADLVLPVLDGFDEIAEGLRSEALKALNATRLPLVLTSRRTEFAEAVEATHAPLGRAACIELADLTVDDLAAYLPRTARPIPRGDGQGGEGTVWDVVLDELRAGKSPGSTALARVLSTPLMIVLARTMYSDMPVGAPAELLDTERFPTESSVEEHLLAGFVPTVYRRRAPARVVVGRRRGERMWDPERAERWLGYLAQHLVHLDRDRQDLAWWEIGDSLRRSTRVLAVVLTAALCVAVSDWCVGFVTARVAPGEILLQGALMGPAAGLAFGCVYGGMVALGGGTFEPTRVRLRLPGTGDGIGVPGGVGIRGGIGRRPVRLFTTRFGAVLLGGFVMGVGCACALTLERGLYNGLPITDPGVIEGTLINMLVFGLIFGWGTGLVFGLLAALEAPLDVTSAATPVSMLAANRATVGRQLLVLVPVLAVSIALGGPLVIGLLHGILGPLQWGLKDGIFIGAVAGLGGGLAYTLSFTAWGQWVFLARIWLPMTGKLPWDVIAFLDDAYRRGVLRQAGAVYQFRHIRLQHQLGRSFRRRQTKASPRWAGLR